MYDEYKKDLRLFENNLQLLNQIENYLIDYGLSKKLKGFLYMRDIIAYAILKKKYSIATIDEASDFIAEKYNIKATSVQRQLRYTCTITSNILPSEILEKAFYKFKGLERNI